MGCGQSSRRRGTGNGARSKPHWRDEPADQDPKGNTLFHVACQNGHKKVAKAVAKFGGSAVMNAQNDMGNTGLHFLVSYGYTELAEYFVSKRADTTIVNAEGRSAL